MTATRPLSITDAIETRRSIRKFEQEPIDAGDLREILRLVSLAPSANNVQTWRFAVIQNPDLQAELQAVSYNQSQVTNAPAVLILYSDMEDVLEHAEETVNPGVGEEQVTARAAKLRENFGSKSIEERAQWANAQAYIALGYLMLAARGLDYDTVPMLGFQPDKVKELLELPTHVQIAAMVPIGKRAEEGYPHHRHSVERLTTFYSTIK